MSPTYAHSHAHDARACKKPHARTHTHVHAQCTGTHTDTNHTNPTHLATNTRHLHKPPHVHSVKMVILTTKINMYGHGARRCTATAYDSTVACMWPPCSDMDMAQSKSLQLCSCYSGGICSAELGVASITPAIGHDSTIGLLANMVLVVGFLRNRIIMFRLLA